MIEYILAYLTRRGVRGTARFARAIERDDPRFVWATTRHGVCMQLDVGSVVDNSILRDGYYEPEVLDAVLDHLPRDLQTRGVFWDIGTNMGLHSLTVKRLRPEATVVSFEPSPFAYGRLLRNMARNDLVLRAMNIALSDENGYVELNIAANACHGLTSLISANGVRYAYKTQCRRERGDTLVGEGVIPAPTVIKLDVEGHEFAVLKGLGSLLQDAAITAIVFEAQTRSVELEATSQPYRCLEIAGFRLVPLPSASGAINNYLATRGSI
jgi:FkbM family methyltransferase